MIAAGSWQTRKERINHRVLHNQFLLSLRAVERKLEQGSLTPDRQRELLEEILPRWDAIRREIQELIATFEEVMSPAQFFRVPPLTAVRAGTGSWLEALVVSLWRSRHQVSGLLESIDAALREADRVQGQLLGDWSRLKHEERLAEVRALAKASLSLSGRLSRFSPATRGL